MKRPLDGFDASGDGFLSGPDNFLAGQDPAGTFAATSPPVETPPAATPAGAASLSVAASTSVSAASATLDLAGPAVVPLDNFSMLANPGSDGPTTSAAAFPGGATAAQLQQALNESGLSVNGAGIKVGVISDSFNDLGGAAADEASGALPSAANVQVLKDLSSGGTDEGRAMMQIVHEIAPGASLAFYTADVSEQDFANGILALAAAGCKVICDDVSYFDEPMFQNGIVAQAIQTVEAEGVTYVAAAANNASNAYQAAWTHSSGAADGLNFTDAESFGGSVVQTITVTASSAHPVPLLLEWDRAYGQANFNSGQPDIDMFVYQNGVLLTQATNAAVGEPDNPFTGVEFTASGTYQIVIVNNFGPDPGTIKEVLFGNGASVSISGANAGTVYGHAMMPGVITAGAVSVASTPAFGVSPAVNETFSSSGAGDELLFANDGTRLASPQSLSPVAVSGLDGIATTVPGGLSDFFGTSAASASLAGVAALILAEDPNLTPAQVEQIMEQTALPMANSVVSGAGLVNVDAAVAAAQALATVVIESYGSTELAQVNSNYFLDPVAGGTGPELKYSGAAFVAGSTFGAYAPIGAEAIAGGYELAFKAGADSYAVWDTDANGNLTTIALGTTSGSSTALETLEVSFHQDLNGDHVIGVPPATSTTIEAYGGTALVQTGSNYFLNPVAGGTGPELKYGGVAFAANTTWGAWAPIGAEAITGGYEVAFKIGADTYAVWDTDANGNLTTIALGTTSGSNPALEALEPGFQQDLNGDHVIGVPSAPSSTTIEAFGATALLQTGNNYFLNPVAGGTGPELKYGGAAFTANTTWGAWAPIGAEAITGGYEVAFKIGNDTYAVWNTDLNGNLTTVALGTTSGSNTALEALEPSFQQDLNGDHIIGIPGQTSSLAQVASVAAVTPATPASVIGGDAFAFRPDLGSNVANNAPPAADEAGRLLTSLIGHLDTQVQHIAADVVDLADTHPVTATTQGPLLDLLHAFIVH